MWSMFHGNINRYPADWKYVPINGAEFACWLTEWEVLDEEENDAFGDDQWYCATEGEANNSEDAEITESPSKDEKESPNCAEENPQVEDASELSQGGKLSQQAELDNNAVIKDKWDQQSGLLCDNVVEQHLSHPKLSDHDDIDVNYNASVEDNCESMFEQQFNGGDLSDHAEKDSDDKSEQEGKGRLLFRAYRDMFDGWNRHILEAMVMACRWALLNCRITAPTESVDIGAVNAELYVALERLLDFPKRSKDILLRFVGQALGVQPSTLFGHCDENISCNNL